nr:MAG TPA: Putative HNHc nuclease [Caudoviricetes sp.]
MIMEIIQGKIIDITLEGLLIKAPYTNIDRACLRKYSMVDIGLNDGRYISSEQRKKAYALMNDISEWSGYLPEYVKRLMKAEFVVKRMQSLNKEIFSLSNCDMTTAKEFITYLIDFIIEYDIPTKQPLSELCKVLMKLHQQ